MALSLPFGTSQAPASVSTPGLDGNFGSLGADELRARMLRLTIDTGVFPHVNAVELLLPPGADQPDFAPGDDVSLGLGYAHSDGIVVFTGTIETVTPSISGSLRATATDGGASLAGLRVDRSFEAMSAGDIVQDFLGEAGVEPGSVEAGPSLPFFAADRGRSVLSWIEFLAENAGFVAFVDGEGSLHFGPPASGGPSATFTYGLDVLSLSARDRAPLVAATSVVGEGAAGSEGGDAWAWLLKDPGPVTSEAGDGTPTRSRSDGSIRTADGAAAAAAGWAARSARGARVGELVVAGAPSATPGMLVEVGETPGGALDGAYLVLGARHRIDARSGYTTALRISGPNGGGGGLLGGLL